MLDNGFGMLRETRRGGSAAARLGIANAGRPVLRSGARQVLRDKRISSSDLIDPLGRDIRATWGNFD